MKLKLTWIKLKPIITILLLSLLQLLSFWLHLEIQNIWRSRAGLAGMQYSVAQIRDIPGNPGRVATLLLLLHFDVDCDTFWQGCVSKKYCFKAKLVVQKCDLERQWMLRFFAFFKDLLRLCCANEIFLQYYKKCSMYPFRYQQSSLDCIF